MHLFFIMEHYNKHIHETKNVIVRNDKVIYIVYIDYNDMACIIAGHNTFHGHCYGRSFGLYYGRP